MDPHSNHGSNLQLGQPETHQPCTQVPKIWRGEGLEEGDHDVIRSHGGCFCLLSLMLQMHCIINKEKKVIWHKVTWKILPASTIPLPQDYCAILKSHGWGVVLYLLCSETWVIKWITHRGNLKTLKHKQSTVIEEAKYEDLCSFPQLWWHYNHPDTATPCELQS